MPFYLTSKRGRSMAPRSRQVMLSCPSSLPGHSDFPTPVTCILKVSSNLIMLTAGRVLRRRWDLRSFLRYLSPHAVGLTPGPWQVLTPFSSLSALAFSLKIEDRRISPLCGVHPSTGLSQLYPSGHILRSCTVRFMLRPAVLASTPDWVKLAFSASRLGTVSGQVQPVCYHTNPPSAYISKREIDMITSSQVTR